MARIVFTPFDYAEKYATNGDSKSEPNGNEHENGKAHENGKSNGNHLNGNGVNNNHKV